MLSRIESSLHEDTPLQGRWFTRQHHHSQTPPPPLLPFSLLGDILYLEVALKPNDSLTIGNQYCCSSQIETILKSPGNILLPVSNLIVSPSLSLAQHVATTSNKSPLVIIPLSLHICRTPLSPPLTSPRPSGCPPALISPDVSVSPPSRYLYSPVVLTPLVSHTPSPPPPPSR